MVKHYLDEAISELGELIAITKQDIENIQKLCEFCSKF